MSYYGPQFAGIIKGWYRTTSDPNYACDRERIDKVWSPDCDAILQRYLHQYGTFFTAFCREMLQLVEELTDTSLLSGCRYYEYYIANRAWELPKTRALWQASQESEEKLHRFWTCSRCHAKNTLLDVHPGLIAKQGFPPELCWDCWYSKIAKENDKRAALGPETIALVERFLSESEKLRKCEFCKRRFRLRRNSQLLTEGMIEEDSYGNAFVEYLYPNLFVNTCPRCFAVILQDYAEGSEEERRSRLREFATFTGKTPTQDFPNMCYVARDHDAMAGFLALLRVLRTPEGYAAEYGSFFAALVKTGVLPEGTKRTWRGTVTLAKDGHLCLSMMEKEIDDYLLDRGIPHEKEAPYPSSAMRADWELLLPGGSRIFVEYFGLMNDVHYRRKAKLKLELAAQSGIELLALYPTPSWRATLEERFAELPPLFGRPVG